jgi:lipopolysaccharide exporter
MLVMTDNELSENLAIRSSSPRSASFGIDVVKLISGTTIAQVVGIITAPILTRLYSPAAYGILSVFTSIITIIAIISCLRYEMAIMLPESKENAGNLMIGSIFISLAIAFLTIPIIWLAGPSFTKILNVPELTPYLWWIPPTVFLGGTTVGHPALNYWTTRTKHFGWLSIARVVGVVVIIGIQFAAALLGYANGSSLILASIFGGGIVSTVILAGEIWKHDAKFIIKSYRWNLMLEDLKRYKKFPLFDSWAALLNTISWQLPSFLLATFFSTTVAGLYAMGNNLLRIPMSVVGSSISQVFYQRASEAKKNGTLAGMVEVTYSYLVKIGMFPFLILTIIGKNLFLIILGSNWVEAGVYTQILSIWTFVWFISSPLSTLFRLLEEQEFSLSINIVILVTRVLSLLAGGLLHSARIALFLFAGSGILVYGYLSLATLFHSGVQLSRMLKILLHNLLIFLPIGCLLIVLLILNLNSWILVGISGVILFIYYLYLMKSDTRILGFITRMLHSRANNN